MTYYFTYGSGDPDMPFQGGWTEVEAPDPPTAIKIFNMVHPPRRGQFLNCSSVYPQEQFEKTEMAQVGNFGARCQERIILKIERSTA